jgi:hypothetical protein
MDYDPAYPKFVTTASTSESAEITAQECDTEEKTDSDTVDFVQDTANTQKEEHTDVLEKLNKLFNIDTQKDSDTTD